MYYYNFSKVYSRLPFSAELFALDNGLCLLKDDNGCDVFRSEAKLVLVSIGPVDLPSTEVLSEVPNYLANDSRDLIDDRAPDEVHNRIFPPFPYQHNANQRRSGTERVEPSGASLSREPSRQSPPSSGRTRLVSNQAGPTTLSIDSMEARTVFTVILPQIQRERPTLQEMRLKGQVLKADANNYEFVFKASDIVRQGGRRKIVMCGVRATRQGRGLGDFGVSGLTCELSKRNLRGWGKSERYYPVRNRNIVEELQPYVLEQVRNRIFPHFPYQHNANHRRAGAVRAGSARAGPSQAGPPRPQRRQSLSSSGRTRLLSNQAGPSTLEIDSMEARTVFTVILPQIQRERPTLQEIHKADANNYEFVFKASDIVRQGGTRKIVKCGVRATRHGRGLRDFGVSGLTCELPRRSLRGRGRSERYYPVRNRNFEKEFQSNDLEQVRNRIFSPFPNLFNVPENLNWRRPGAPRTEPPPPPQDLPEHLPGAPPMEDDPSGARPPHVGPPQAWPRQTRLIQPGYRDDLPQPSEDFSLEDPPTVNCPTLLNPRPTSIHMKIPLMVVILLFVVQVYSCAPIEHPPIPTTTKLDWLYQFWYFFVIVPVLILLCGEPNNSESSSSETESVSKKKKKTKKVKKTVRKYLYFPKSDEQEHESTKATKNSTKSTISPQETTRMITDSMITSSTSSTFDRTLKSFIPSTSPVKISLSSTVSKLSKPSKVSSAKSTIKTIIKTPPSKLAPKENVKHRATDKKAKPVQSRFKEKPPK